ncbi:MAG: response regulator [Methanoregula sp.]|nr:response regulator [Methanoregula sp.]
MARGKILLMDDEQVIVDVTLDVLRYLDYEVMFARDGAAALGLYKQEKDAGMPFDLVILDLSVQEGMGGKEAIALLKAYDPAVKAIVSSGYSSDPVVQHFMQYGFSGRLSKPYKISDLKEILEQMIKKPDMGPASSGPIRF